MSEDLLTGEAFGHLSSCKHRGVFADATVRALVEDAEAGCFKCIVLTEAISKSNSAFPLDTNIVVLGGSFDHPGLFIDINTYLPRDQIVILSIFNGKCK